MPKKKTKIVIPLLLENCTECPMVDSDRTPGAGCATDYFCKAKNDKKIMGYIEWEREIRPVPKWCPYRVK